MGWDGMEWDLDRDVGSLQSNSELKTKNLLVFALKSLLVQKGEQVKHL